LETKYIFMPRLHKYTNKDYLLFCCHSFIITFLLEAMVIGYSYFYYTGKTSPVPKYKNKSELLTKCLGILLAIEHILFTFFIVPTENVQFVHAPLFLGQILLTSLLAHFADKLRIDNYSFWKKSGNFQRKHPRFTVYL